MKDTSKYISPAWYKRVSIRKVFLRVFIYLLVIGGATAYLLPLFWMISTSLKPNDQVFTTPIQWIPRPPHWENYVDAWVTYYPFTRFLINSCIIAGGAIIGNLISAPLVAYSFARLRWPLRDTFFYILLLTMLIPYPVVMVPQFVLFYKLGWINTYLPFIVPAFCGGHFTYFL